MMKIMLQKERTVASSDSLYPVMNRVMKTVGNHWVFFTLTLVGIITWLSLRTPGIVAVQPLPGLDKVQHVLAYAVLIVPLMLARPKNWQYCAMLLFALSGLIELLQPWFSRTTDVADMLANGTGLMVGIAMVSGFRGSVYYSGRNRMKRTNG